MSIELKSLWVGSKVRSFFVSVVVLFCVFGVVFFFHRNRKRSLSLS